MRRRIRQDPSTRFAHLVVSNHLQVDTMIVVGVRVLNSSHAGVGSGSMAYESATDAASAGGRDRKFSLWGVLFSNTFSSLVHSLLTSSFQSVHTKVVSTLRLSLTNAPPLESILPHEAYRNTLHIASELDTALSKVSDDAHELLVHAEERTESERRLRQSLYVQTCEIMGRLICELRRMLLISDTYDAVKHLIVGRLCHLLSREICERISREMEQLKIDRKKSA